MIFKNEIPILEYDDDRTAVINPARKKTVEIFPEKCVMTFFKEIVEKYAESEGTKKIASFKWENGNIDVYKLIYRGQEIAFVHLHVGAPVAVGIFEDIIGYGGKQFIACGGCGVLDDIDQSEILIPVSAVRDEGTSYHYKKASREIEISQKGISAITKTLTEHKINYKKCKIWTTDAFFREIKEKIQHRKSEGCLCVDMECSALATVAEYRNVDFAQFVYSGDNLVGEKYEDRNWSYNVSTRERMFLLALEACFNYG